MTSWNIDMYKSGGEVWVHQYVEGQRPRFVARFKYYKPTANARDFVKFITKHFTVDEYFHCLEIDHVAPLMIAKTKGYESLNVRAARKM